MSGENNSSFCTKPEEAAKKVVDTFGAEIIGDRKRFCAAFNDFAPKLRKESKAFDVALSEDLGKLYLRENNSVKQGEKSPEEVIGRAIVEIGEYLNREKAEMAAYALAYAIGWSVTPVKREESQQLASTGSGIEELFHRAEMGNNDACFNLGERFYYGKGVKQDYVKAVEWYTKAAENDDCSSQKKLAGCYHLGQGAKRDLSKAAYWYEKAAEQGDYDSQKALILCYKLGGINLNPDKKKAEMFSKRYNIPLTDDGLEDLITEAENDSPNAQFALGNIYYDGIGTAADREKAVYWYTRAAENDYAPAQFNLACCYASGTGVEKDVKKAAELYRKAADNGNLDAMNNLAGCFVRGEGVPESKWIAADLYLKAAEGGHIRAQYNYGECKYYGIGVSRDYAEAASWYKKAAQFDSDAQYSYGWCCFKGKGVVMDHAQAKQMFELAAQQRNAAAQKALGYCYLNGYGTEKNYAKAAEEFRKAALRGDKEAAKMNVFCRKYGGYFLIRDEEKARKLAESYGIDYDEI